MSYREPKEKPDTLIFHVDVNSAFLSWSALKMLQENPSSVDLRTIPSAVAGDVSTRHGIITSRSVPAKKYGVKTAEPVVSALRKCPDLVLVKSDFTVYRDYSRRLMGILKKHAAALEQVSIDEAYLDMSFLLDEEPYSARILKEAEAIQSEVLDTLKFTVNVGVSCNRLLAKTASDFEKPGKIHSLWPYEISEKLWPMEIRELHGCGPATAEKLNGIGILTVGDAAAADPEILKHLLGDRGGEYIFKSANGQGSSHIEGEVSEARGYSGETTTAEDITAENYEKEVPPILHELSQKVSRRMEKDGMFGQTIGVMVKTDGFQRRSKQTAADYSTNSADIIEKYAAKLMRELLFGDGGLFGQGWKIRLIGVRVTKLDHGEYRQMNLFDLGLKEYDPKETETKKKLDEMVAKLQKKYGKNAVKKGLD